MKLSEKIAALRKSHGLSQEALAEKLNVSRQTVSRWETGTAMPDAANLLQLSRLFHVTADQLLNDEYQSGGDPPQAQEEKAEGVRQVMFYLVILEGMILLMQFMTVVILRSWFFGVQTFLLFAALIGGFEYAYRKRAGGNNERTARFRRRFYQISAWLGTYFPVRLAVTTLTGLCLRNCPPLVLECIILAIYLAAAALLSLEIDRRDLPA